MTVAASELEQLLRRRFPSLLFERVNCRRIAGSRTWSQHSWPGGNARDIFGPDKKPSPSSQALLDAVAAYLRSNQIRYGIKRILWRVPDHWNHVHADMWPTGYGFPPCAGGLERYCYSDGRVVFGHNGQVRPQGTFEEEDDNVRIFPGERGSYVKPYQQALNKWGMGAPGIPGVPGWVLLAEDGNYGPATTSAVVTYQNAAGLQAKPGIVLGQLDDLTRDLLERYVEA